MKIIRRSAIPTGVTLLLCIAAMPAVCQTNAVLSQREKNKAVVAKTFETDKKAHGANSNMFVRPGLLANRAEQWVRIQAEAVGASASSPCEFMLIAEASGHDYEALMVSFAQPSDIHAALVFIGMTPGLPVDGNKCRFWPKGERVIPTVEWDNGKHFSARGESLIINRGMNGPLPKDGFVFVGSVMKDAPNETPGKKIYAADVFNPNCIASYYNDIETVLDVPRVAGKTAMYDSQYPNPEYSFATGQLVRVTLEPEHKDGRKRVVDFVLGVAPPAPPAAASFSNVVARLAGGTGADSMPGNRLQDALTVFQRVVKDGCDPFVSIEFDGQLPLSTVRDVCRFLDAINTEKGIRIEPPPNGHAYYRAFIPDEKLRDRANRAVQPWEVRLSASNGVAGGSMLLTEDKLNRETGKWSTVTRQFDAATPDEMRKVFDMRTEDDSSQRIGPPYVFFFAPRTMLYKTLAPFVAACLETRPIVHVYIE